MRRLLDELLRELLFRKPSQRVKSLVGKEVYETDPQPTQCEFPLGNPKGWHPGVSWLACPSKICTVATLR